MRVSNSRNLLEYARRREEKCLIQIINIGEIEIYQKEIPPDYSGGIFTCSANTFLTMCRVRICSLWYTGRDSNPQPSEPESDALSIEPPVHFDSLNIIAGFDSFVKRKGKIIFLSPGTFLRKWLFSLENCGIIRINVCVRSVPLWQKP